MQRAVARAIPPGARAIRPATRTREIARMLRSFRLNLEALAYVALLVGMYLIYNTVAISVVQRRPEIGTVRALGATRGAVFRTFLAEGALIGVARIARSGWRSGAALATFSVAAVTRTVDTFYVATHADRVVYDPVLFVKAFVLGVVASIVAAAIPALDAAVDAARDRDARARLRAAPAALRGARGVRRRGAARARLGLHAAPRDRRCPGVRLRGRAC